MVVNIINLKESGSIKLNLWKLMFLSLTKQIIIDNSKIETF